MSAVFGPIFRAAVPPVVMLGITALTIHTGLLGHLTQRAVTDMTQGAATGATNGIQTAITAGVSELGRQLQSMNLGKSAGEQLATIFRQFVEGTGFDAATSAQQISTIGETFIKNLNAGKLAGAFGEQVNDAFYTTFDTLDIGDKARHLGDELADGLKQGTEPLGRGARQAAANIFGEIAKGATIDVLPWVAAGIMLVTAAPLSMYYLYYKAKHAIGRPKLACEIHQRNILTPLNERIKGAASFLFRAPQKKPIYNAEITRRIRDIIRATNNIRKHRGYFRNVLFYGPGGTGKTMISEFIAKNSGMSYVKMSGGDLAQYIKRGEHVTELNKLLDKMERSWRPWSSRPWILFIDEAESLCRDRSKIPTAELLELQNAFLNRTGTESKKFMIVLSTNREEDLDEAILSRMDDKIYIGPPAEQERLEILKSYIPQFFSRTEQATFFKNSQIQIMAQGTDGLTGRALFKLMNAIFNKKAASDDRKLTQSMIDQTVKDFTLQEKELERKRAQKAIAQNQTSKELQSIVQAAPSTKAKELPAPKTIRKD